MAGTKPDVAGNRRTIRTVSNAASRPSASGLERFHKGCQAKKEHVSAQDSPVAYVAIGPVFATSSKLVPDPVVGLEGVRAARAITDKLVVAIGGIGRSNCAAVIAAGALSVAG
jgi:Thiamine monophosphate synthase